MDPFAFNMGAFDMGSSSAPATETRADQQPASADPYAFDMGSFGGDPAPAAAPPPQQAPTAADPFAFDMGAFGMGTDSQQEAGHQTKSQPGPPPASSGDPFAFNPDAFGMGDAAGSGHAEQPDSAAPVPAAAADPFAFNPEAFGMGQPPQQVPGSAQAAPAPGAAADHFAFDPEAFGMDQLGQPLQQPPGSAQAGHGRDSAASNEDISVKGHQRQGAASVPGSRTTGTSLPGAAQSPARDRSQRRQQAAAVFQPRRPGSKPADALSLEELEALERLLLPQVDPSDDEGELTLHKTAVWQLQMSHSSEGRLIYMYDCMRPCLVAFVHLLSIKALAQVSSYSARITGPRASCVLCLPDNQGEEAWQILLHALQMIWQGRLTSHSRCRSGAHGQPARPPLRWGSLISRHWRCLSLRSCCAPLQRSVHSRPLLVRWNLQQGEAHLCSLAVHRPKLSLPSTI